MEWLLAYIDMVTVPHQMFGLEKISDYRGVGLERFHCIYSHTWFIRHWFIQKPHLSDTLL